MWKARMREKRAYVKCEKFDQWQLAVGLLAKMVVSTAHQDNMTLNSAISLMKSVVCEKGVQ